MPAVVWVQVWPTFDAPVRWMTHAGLATVNHTVLITREEHTSLYTTLTSDVANAFALLCEHHGRCAGVGRRAKTEAASALAGSGAETMPDNTSTMLRGGGMRLKEATDAEPLGKQQYAYDTMVVFADGTDDGAARSQFEDVWACISGTFSLDPLSLTCISISFDPAARNTSSCGEALDMHMLADHPTLVTGPEDPVTQDRMLLMDHTTFGLGETCRGEFWCSSAHPCPVKSAAAQASAACILL